MSTGNIETSHLWDGPKEDRSTNVRKGWGDPGTEGRRAGERCHIGNIFMFDLQSLRQSGVNYQNLV